MAGENLWPGPRRWGRGRVSLPPAAANGPGEGPRKRPMGPGRGLGSGQTGMAVSGSALGAWLPARPGAGASSGAWLNRDAEAFAPPVGGAIGAADIKRLLGQWPKRVAREVLAAPFSPKNLFLWPDSELGPPGARLGGRPGRWALGLNRSFFFDPLGPAGPIFGYPHESHRGRGRRGRL